jgi:endonuclease YncB( thermonuclease family)
MFESIIRSFETAFLILLINLNFWGLNLTEIKQNQVIRVIDGDTFEIYLSLT